MSGTVGFELIKDEHGNKAENLLLHPLSTQKDTHNIIGSRIEIYTGVKVTQNENR